MLDALKSEGRTINLFMSETFLNVMKDKPNVASYYFLKTMLESVSGASEFFKNRNLGNREVFCDVIAGTKAVPIVQQVLWNL